MRLYFTLATLFLRLTFEPPHDKTNKKACAPREDSDHARQAKTQIISCFSKFLSKLLCNRLEKFLNENRIICDEQIGFKKGCRTSDHILSLKTLIDKAFKKLKYLYCCFIDLRKAFDIVNRTALFAKLSRYNIQGFFLQVLENMYKEIYYSVKLPEGLTHKISSTVGLKQGCILSPTLFFFVYK